MKKAAYSIKELVHETGISRTKLYQEMSAGRITAHKNGRRTIILGREVERYLENLPERERQN
jgi:excisionase family DNA binding protein